MTKRLFFLILFVVAVSTFAFAIPKVNVAISSDTATVTTKLYEYSVDLKNGFLTNEYSVFYEHVHSWADRKSVV